MKPIIEQIEVFLYLLKKTNTTIRLNSCNSYKFV